MSGTTEPKSDFDYTLHYSTWHSDTPEAREHEVANFVAHLRRVLPPATKEGTALDIGCANGTAVVALQRLGYVRASGVDIDSGQIEKCRQFGVPAELVEDTERYLLERPNQYEVVLMMDVLEHLPRTNQIGLMRAIHTALSPGGRVLLKVPNANSPIAPRWRYIDFTHYSSFTEHSLQFVLRNANFRDISLVPPPDESAAPKRFFSRDTLFGLRRSAVRWFWRQVYASEFGMKVAKSIPLDKNLFAIAVKSAVESPQKQ